MTRTHLPGRVRLGLAIVLAVVAVMAILTWLPGFMAPRV
jgi:hypothetical protein